MATESCGGVLVPITGVAGVMLVHALVVALHSHVWLLILALPVPALPPNTTSTPRVLS